MPVVDSPVSLVNFRGAPQAMTSRVQDRRRFHPDGTPRDDEPTTDPAIPVAEDTSPPATPGENPEVSQLRADLATAQRRVDELARGIQEVMKDRDDFKARVNRERERLLEVEKGQVALALIETLDELDLSLQSADDSPLAHGVRLIRDKLLQRLEAAGVERLRLLGRPYDPNLAEAADIELVPSPAQNEQVLEEQRAAYALKGRVIRPGRVKVGRYLAPAKA
jgi:molecular chaperone GrpE